MYKANLNVTQMPCLILTLIGRRLKKRSESSVILRRKAVVSSMIASKSFTGC